MVGIGLASMFSDIGHEMATTAMPVLLASVGAGSAVLGLIEGLADGFSSFLFMESWPPDRTGVAQPAKLMQ